MFTSTTRKAIAATATALIATVTVAACGSGGGGGEPTVSAADQTSELAAAQGPSAEANASGAKLPDGSEPVKLDPSEFTSTIDNPYWPMAVGSKWTYRESDTAGTRETAVVEVTNETKTIANGVEARVIRDTVSEHGVPVEVTDDWYAQDSQGNIWYLGEYVTNYENGKVVDHGGSFEAGVDGAQAGIALPAHPEPGMDYRQEFYKGEAEDRGGVITVGQEQVQVPFGHFDRGVLMTRDLTPTEPKVQELKFYGPGVGPLLSVHLDGAGGRAELVSYEPGR